MPKCKNDPSRTYKGTEPSPKGLGFCAHGMKEGAIKKGKDGNKWIIKKVKNGSKRWIKVSDKVKPQKIDKKVKKKQGKQGLLEKTGKMYTLNKELIEGFVVEKNPDSKMYGKYIKGGLRGYKKYLTHWNGGRPYLCYFKKDKLNNRYDVLIYSRDKGIKLNDKQYGQLITPKGADKFAWAYTKYVKDYYAEKVFVGIDSDDRSFSRGNTILLKLTNKFIKASTGKVSNRFKLNRYVFIEGEIYEFSTTDEIVKYYSIVGNGDVPYPIAVGKENVYFMLDRKYIPLKYFPKKMKAKDFEEAYDLFYDYTVSNNDEEKEPIAKDAKIYNFKNVKKIHMEA